MALKELKDHAVTWRGHGEEQQQTLASQTAHEQLLEEVRTRTDWRKSA